MAEREVETGPRKRFEQKSDAVFDEIVENCGVMDTEMSEDTDHNLTPTLASMSYGMPNQTGSENSLLDEDDYFLNSGDLAGIPVVSSDNEDEQDCSSKDNLVSSVHTDGSLEVERRAAHQESDNENEIQIQNQLKKDFPKQFDQVSVFKSIRKDFCLVRENSKETFSGKEKNRDLTYHEREKRLDKPHKGLDSRLKSSFFDKAANQVEETLHTHLPQNPETNFRDSSYPFASKESIGSELGNSFASNIRIKEEPLDDEYDRAVAPQQGLLDRVKDEPDNAQASTQTDALKLPPSQPPRLLKNKALLCKPITQTKATSCKPHTQNKECQTDTPSEPQVMVVPVPVPVFVPIPLHLYTQYTPVPFGIPVPMPVPMFIPSSMDNDEKATEGIEDIKEKLATHPFEADLLEMAEMIAEDEEKEKTLSQGESQTSEQELFLDTKIFEKDQGSTYSGDLESEAVSTPHSWEEELNHYALKSNAVQDADSELKPFSKGETEQDLEADFPSESFDPLNKGQGIQARSRTRRRHRDGFPQPRRRGRKKSVVPVEPRSLIQGALQGCSVSGMTLKYMYGVNAWKNWVQWKNAKDEQGDLKCGGGELASASPCSDSLGSAQDHALSQESSEQGCKARSVKLKEDILSCTFSELSLGLCQFIQEVRRPNGEKYDPDSILYLCLGIQQYLFENGRIDNIFTEPYSRFMIELTKLLKIWEPTILPNGYVFSRIEEEHLWECKQLGAYSPIVLLNTLLFFNTKYFQLRNVTEHLKLSFAHVMRRTRTLKYSTKMTYLRFFPPLQKPESEPDKVTIGKRKRNEDDEAPVGVEMAENTDNPLRCPVRLYEFYLSKCSESVKQRSDVFYLQPERSCVPNSPMWYSTFPIDPGTLDTMLTRILMVREVHEELAKAKSEDSDAELSD